MKILILEGSPNRKGPRVQKDGMEEIRGKLLNADMLVFVTPLYYYGMSA